MKKMSYVLASLAILAFAVPAIAQDKPMKEGMSEKPMMHHRMHMHQHHRHHMMMKKRMMKKDSM